MMSNAVMLVLLLVPSLMAFSMVTSGGNYLRDQHPMTSAGLVGGSSSSNFQYQPWQDYATAPEYVSQIQMKRASNLGSRLMCQLDSRNCGAGFQKGGDSYWWMKNNY
ncbi:uncharacterized protein LOC111048020 isoform X3 [Nilaparvata lugens]|uniref:uncharacterized protein LOC111048020 isoform X3 n=1 Tax=Nilaparvata lugens TaxID=108931 RepID=UPI00193D7684|nr:uncharacterized protein LOC111048020 isoform X3 [Nilaparvata lugens]